MLLKRWKTVSRQFDICTCTVMEETSKLLLSPTHTNSTFKCHTRDYCIVELPCFRQTGRKGGSFHRGASVGWATTRGCWRHQMDPFLVLSLFNAAPYLTLDECWVITPFITQITLKNYSTLKCFTTMKEIFLYQHDEKLILCLIRQLDFTFSHSQSEFPTRQETIFVLFLDWILDACNYYESGSIFMVQ